MGFKTIVLTAVTDVEPNHASKNKSAITDPLFYCTICHPSVGDFHVSIIFIIN